MTVAPVVQDLRTVVIGAGFTGPPTAANGGYACGVFSGLAAAADPAHDGPRAVTLHLPVPLEVPLHYVPAGRRGHVLAGEELIASVVRTVDDVPAVPFVDAAVAAAAESGFPGRTGHPFPTCFACGGEHPDGLRLTPGAVPGGGGTVACRWTPRPGPDGRVPDAVTTAALDCPGGWTEDARRRPRVLGRLVAVLDRPPRPGRTHVVVARELSRDDRTAVRLTTLYDADDPDAGPVGRSSAIWIALTA